MGTTPSTTTITTTITTSTTRRTYLHRLSSLASSRTSPPQCEPTPRARRRQRPPAPCAPARSACAHTTKKKLEKEKVTQPTALGFSHSPYIYKLFASQVLDAIVRSQNCLPKRVSLISSRVQIIKQNLREKLK